MDFSNFDILPDEAIFHIFRFLHPRDLIRVGWVCRNWHRVYLANRKYLWDGMDLVIGKFDRKSSIDYRCIQMVPLLRSLYLYVSMNDNGIEESIKVISEIIKHPPKNVRKLYISTDFPYSSLLGLLDCYRDHLEELSIEFNEDADLWLISWWSPIWRLGGDFPMLRTLHVHRKVSVLVRDEEASSFPKLEELFIQDIEEDCLELLLYNHPLLEVLKNQLVTLHLSFIDPKKDLLEDGNEDENRETEGEFFDFFPAMENVNFICESVEKSIRDKADWRHWWLNECLNCFLLLFCLIFICSSFCLLTILQLPLISSANGLLCFLFGCSFFYLSILVWAFLLAELLALFIFP